MKRTLTIIAIVIVILMTVVGIATGISYWLGDMFFDWNAQSWAD